MRLVLAVAALCLAGATSASAASISITASDDPVGDAAYQLTVQGTADSGGTVTATIKPAGGRPCAANRDADDGDGLLREYPSKAGPFQYTRNQTSEAGSYVVCAWLQRDSDGAVVTSNSLTVNVRVPKSTVTFQVPAAIKSGAAFPLGMTAQTEVSRNVYAYIDNPGIACGANQDANQALDQVFREENQGGPTSYTTNVTLTRPGTYTLCAYVWDDNADAPEYTTSAQLTVPGKTAPSYKASAKIHHRVLTLYVNCRVGPCPPTTVTLRRGKRTARIVFPNGVSGLEKVSVKLGRKTAKALAGHTVSVTGLGSISAMFVRAT